MKILFITPTFYNPKKVPGGMEKYLYNLIIRLREKNQVILLIPAKYNFQIENVRIYHYYEKSRPFQLVTNIFSSYLSFLNILVHERPQIVSIFLGNVQTFFILALSKFLRIKTVINLRGALEKITVMDYFFGLSFLFANNIVTNSKDIIQKYALDFPALRNFVYSPKAFFIPNGIDTDLWKPSPVSIEKSYDLCMMANIRDLHRINEKGVPYLFQALKIIEKKYGKKLKLLFIGDYSIDLLKKRIQDWDPTYFEFSGLIVKKKNIIRKIQQAKIFVLTSLSEGMSNVLLEAMALGLPCISTSVGAASELIHDNENGFLVPSKNAEALAEKIWFLLNNIQLQKTLGMNARILMQRHYDWKKNVNLVESCYKKISNAK